MYDDRTRFCSCSFMEKIFFIGGSSRSSSLQLNTKNLRWKEISTTIQERSSASCVVYEGNIVVACGEINTLFSNTVESYDVASDTWISMPSLIEPRYLPSFVVAKRKLFVMGGDTRMIRTYRVNCEAFDNVCNKFVALKSPEFNENFVVSAGNRILVFKVRGNDVLSYDIEKDEWSAELSGLELCHYFSCVHVNLPMY